MTDEKLEIMCVFMAGTAARLTEAEKTLIDACLRLLKEKGELVTRTKRLEWDLVQLRAVDKQNRA